MADSTLRWREMLPIVTRELRVASKRRATYRLRLIVALLGAGGLLLGAMLAGPSVEMGQWLFRIMSGVMLGGASLAGLVLTADCISKEKREGTLGLLFLTRLVGADVALGKLGVAVLCGGSVAFAAAPFLAVSICLGGVTAREFCEMSALLVFLLAYSLVLGIFISTLFRREVVVSLLFCLAMFLPVIATPLAILKWKTLPEFYAQINPFFPALKMIEGGFFLPAEYLRPTLIFQTFAMVAMLGFSCAYLPWTVRSREAGAQRKEPTRLRRASHRAILDSNPMLWLGERKNHPLVLLFLCAGLRLCLGFSSKTPFEVDLAYILLLAILPKLFVLWQSSGMMAAERESGFLETVLTTPIPSSEVLQGKMRAMKRQIFPTLLFALLVQWMTATKWWSAAGAIPWETTSLFVAMIMLLVDVHTIAWVGMWQGLVARDRRRALIGAALWGCIGPWLPVLLIGAVFQIIFDPTIREPALVIAPALIIANACSIAIACLAMAQLHEKFRSTATETWSLKPI